MELKSFDNLLKAIENELQEKAINKTNPKGIAHANSLIASKDVKYPSSWERPTVEMENAYIEKNGWSEYAKWFLGVDTSEDADTKGHYGYIYTSDFKTVDRQALRAIRQRSAQRGLTSIFAAAGKMIEKIDDKNND
jgi:hypothetical protein